MTLKSLVNKSVIKSDLRRYWYLGAIFAILLFFTAVVQAYHIVNFYAYTDTQTNSTFLGGVIPTLFAVLTCCIATPAMMFSYLHHRSAVHTIHSLPLRRETLYFSHMISMAILEILPIIINMLIMLTIKGIRPSDVFLWAGLTLVYVFVITALGTAISILTANVFASIVIPYYVILLPLFIEGVSEVLCYIYLFGYSDNNAMSISSHIYADYTHICDGMIYVYTALGLILFALGLVAYKKRALENHSQLVAFKFLNPVFIYGVAVCAGLLGYIYLASLLGNGKQFWIAIPTGIIGIIGAKMIAERTFRPKKVIKPSVIYLAMLFGIYLFIGFDITGFENRIPDMDKIASASVVEYGYGEDYYPTTDVHTQVKLAPEAIHDSALYNAEDIAKVTALHREIIKNSDVADSTDNRNGMWRIPIKYVLKNGHTIERLYSISNINDKTLYESVMDIKAVKADRFPIIADVAQEYVSARVSTCGTNETNLTNEQMYALIDTLREDILAASFDDYCTDALTSVNLVRSMPSIDDSGNLITDKKGWAQQSCTYDIHSSYKKTIALLSDWGLYNVMPEADRIRYVEFCGENDEIKTETDKVYIAKCLDYLYTNSDNLGRGDDKEVMSITIHYNNDTAYTININDTPNDTDL